MVLKYVFAWFGMMAIAVANGGIRDRAYKVKVGDLASRSWRELMHAYDLSAGQVWMFIPLWVLVGPYLLFRLSKGT